MFAPHPRVTSDPEGPSRTKQSFQEESEINNIVARYQKRGIIDHLSKYGGTYGDMPAPDDFHEAMTLVTEAQSMFEELPSNVRNRFKNDPAEFLDFVGNEENAAEMVEMGLMDPIPPEPAPEAVPAEETTATATVDAAPVGGSQAPGGAVAQ